MKKCISASIPNCSISNLKTLRYTLALAFIQAILLTINYFKQSAKAHHALLCSDSTNSNHPIISLNAYSQPLLARQD